MTAQKLPLLEHGQMQVSLFYLMDQELQKGVCQIYLCDYLPLGAE